jgi:hypothetical protein
MPIILAPDGPFGWFLFERHHKPQSVEEGQLKVARIVYSFVYRLLMSKPQNYQRYESMPDMSLQDCFISLRSKRLIKRLPCY